MTPREFILHWHREARLAPPRLVPDSWERQALMLLGRGITAEDLTLVAKWMLTQLARSQGGERNSVAFNAASFAWPKMFGRIGDVPGGDEFSRFAALLASAEASKPKRAQAVQPPRSAPAAATDDAAAKRRRDEVMERFKREMQGGPP